MAHPPRVPLGTLALTLALLLHLPGPALPLTSSDIAWERDGLLESSMALPSTDADEALPALAHASSSAAAAAAAASAAAASSSSSGSASRAAAAVPGLPGNGADDDANPFWGTPSLFLDESSASSSRAASASHHARRVSGRGGGGLVAAARAKLVAFKSAASVADANAAAAAAAHAVSAYASLAASVAAAASASASASGSATASPSASASAFAAASEPAAPRLWHSPANPSSFPAAAAAAASGLYLHTAHSMHASLSDALQRSTFTLGKETPSSPRFKGTSAETNPLKGVKEEDTVYE